MEDITYRLGVNDSIILSTVFETMQEAVLGATQLLSDPEMFDELEGMDVWKVDVELRFAETDETLEIIPLWELIGE